jgi:L-lactate utilization protein LutC
MRDFFNQKLGLGVSKSEVNAPRYGNKTASMFEQLKRNPALYNEFVTKYPALKQYIYQQAKEQQQEAATQNQSTQAGTTPGSTAGGAVSETVIGQKNDQVSVLLDGIVNGSKGKSFAGDPIQTSINPWAYAPGYVSDYYNLYRGLKGPDPVQKYQYNPEYVNTRAQEVLLENAANNAYGTVRANLPRSSQAAYLASIGSAYSGIADNLGKQQAQVRQQRDLQNNQLANQAQTINMQSQMQADQTRQQELDAARSWTSQGLASLANRSSQWMADKNANETQNFMLKNMLASKDFQFTDKGIEQSVDLSVKQYMSQGYTYDEAKQKANEEALAKAKAYLSYANSLTGTNAGMNSSLAKAETGVKSETKPNR